MTRQTMVQLTDHLVEALDAEAAKRGVSRSALIREAVAAHLAGATEAAITDAILAGYRRVPPGSPDDWGGLGDGAREVHERLRAEEGEDPW